MDGLPVKLIERWNRGSKLAGWMSYCLVGRHSFKDGKQDDLIAELVVRRTLPSELVGWLVFQLNWQSVGLKSTNENWLSDVLAVYLV